MHKQPSFDNIEFVNHGAFDPFPGKLNPIAAAIRGESEMGGGGSKVFKAIAAVAIAVAIPVFAPTVATAVFGTSSILASAATGAVMGAAGAKLTGGDWRVGALTGGLGGGFGAYNAGAGFTTAAPTEAAAATAAQGAGAVAGPGANSAVITNTGSGTGYFSSELGQFVDPVTGNAIAPQNIAYGGNVSADVATKLSSGGIQPVDLANSMTGISTNTSLAGAQALGSSAMYNPAAGTGTFYDAGAQFNTYAGAGQTVPGATPSATTTPGAADQTQQAAGQPGAKPTSYLGELKSRVTDPSRLADMTLMATPQLIGAAYAAKAGKEQQDRIDQYQRELKALQGKDDAAYKVKLAEAQEYIQNAKNINPSYWAQQSANQAQISGARGLAETYRDDRMAGLRSPSYTASEKRRANIGIGQNVGTAYDRGYGAGLTMRDQSIQRGLGMMPSAPRTGIEGYQTLSNMYSDLDRTRAAAGQGAAQMASYFTYPLLSQQTRDNNRRA
jgi:hypothetical protein